jgi:hypothetical protein
VGEVIAAMVKELAGGKAISSPNAACALETKQTSNGIPEALAAAPGVSLTYASAVQIPPAAESLLQTSKSRPVFLVDNQTNLTGALAQILSTSHLVIIITFKKDRTFNFPTVFLPDRSEESLTRVLNQVQKQHGVPGGLIYQHDTSFPDMPQLGWALLAAKILSPSLQRPIENGRTFFVTLVRLDGKLGLSTSPVSADLSTVFRSQVGALFGLCKTLSLEWTHVFCRGLDLSPSLNDMTAADYVSRELKCPELTIREVGYCENGSRFTSTARELSVPDLGSSADYRADDVLIVSGGARGITPLCIASLARRIRGGTFILMGRSAATQEPAWAKGLEGKALNDAAMIELRKRHEKAGSKPKPKDLNALLEQIAGSREILESCASISAAGGRPIYVACDALSAQSVQGLVTQIHNEYKLKVTGIIHGSGVLRDKKVEQKTAADFDVVYGVKIIGLVNLLAALSPSELKDLRHLVVFSSLAGYHGNIAQTDYSMANEALSKVAHAFTRSYPNCRARSLCFGPWDGGMVTPQLKAQFQANGVQIIPRQGGADQVAALLTLQCPGRLQVLIGNWGFTAVVPRQVNHHIRLSISGPVRPVVSRLILGTYLGWSILEVEKELGGGSGNGACEVSLERAGEIAPLKIQITVKANSVVIYGAVFVLSRGK